jgi:hypothetical protein
MTAEGASIHRSASRSDLIVPGTLSIIFVARTMTIVVAEAWTPDLRLSPHIMPLQE